MWTVWYGCSPLLHFKTQHGNHDSRAPQACTALSSTWYNIVLISTYAEALSQFIIIPFSSNPRGLWVRLLTYSCHYWQIPNCACGRTDWERGDMRVYERKSVVAHVTHFNQLKHLMKGLKKHRRVGILFLILSLAIRCCLQAAKLQQQILWKLCLTLADI